jgi:hypothetical protein
VESEEGRAAVQAFEAMLNDARQQLAAFDGEPGQEVQVRIQFPKEIGRAMVTFIRRMLDMISDPAVMTPIGQERLSEKSRTFVEPYLVFVEAAVAEFEFQQRRGPA